jgi:hypothetical protein
VNNIPVAQSAEALDLKSIQYEFESHRGYRKKVKIYLTFRVGSDIYYKKEL